MARATVSGRLNTGNDDADQIPLHDNLKSRGSIPIAWVELSGKPSRHEARKSSTVVGQVTMGDAGLQG
jgi:hypothetical protein